MNNLIQLISPPTDPQFTGDEKSRMEVNEKLGIVLPDDYFSFLKIYGAGQFCEWINVFNPFINVEYLNLFYRIESERNIYKYSKEAMESDQMRNNPKVKQFKEQYLKECGASGAGYPFGFFPDKGGLIPWGDCEEAAVLFWKMNKGKWTIVVYGEEEYYYEYDMTMTEFLYNLLSMQIQNPIFEGLDFSVPHFQKFIK